MANPKLEFYRFSLVPKKAGYKTFKDFVIEELDKAPEIAAADVSQAFYEYFMASLDKEIAVDNTRKKLVSLVREATINKYLARAPVNDPENFLIQGVINGGRFGNSRILDDLKKKKRPQPLDVNDSVLSYYYFLLYVPPGHNEGCFIIHSNSMDDSVTTVFRGFISRIFKGRRFNKANCSVFSPASFQAEFRKGAVVKSIQFKDAELPVTHENQGVAQLDGVFEITVKIVPIGEEVPLSKVERLRERIQNLVFGRKDEPETLEEFDETKIEVQNPTTGAKKFFEWNAKEDAFVPVVHLKGHVNGTNEDGTPDFEELATFCFDTFKTHVLPEIRPDHDATRT